MSGFGLRSSSGNDQNGREADDRSWPKAKGLLSEREAQFRTFSNRHDRWDDDDERPAF
jgi:hypothetical protein